MTEDLPGIIIALVLIFFAVRYFYPSSESDAEVIPDRPEYSTVGL
jgi:hypothetical protein